MEKLHAEKMWFWETGMSSWRNIKNRGKIGFAFCALTEWWKWKMLHWLTMRHCMDATRHDVALWVGTAHKELLAAYRNEEYYTTAPQRKTLRPIMLCWFAYFVKSCACWRSVFLPSIENRIHVEVECYPWAAHSQVFGEFDFINLLSIFNSRNHPLGSRCMLTFVFFKKLAS